MMMPTAELTLISFEEEEGDVAAFVRVTVVATAEEVTGASSCATLGLAGCCTNVARAISAVTTDDCMIGVNKVS